MEKTAMKFTEFGLKVMTELMIQGKTMTWLSEEMGVTLSYVSRILRGDRCPERRLEQIKNILKIV